jgi:hypothetical protein
MTMSELPILTSPAQSPTLRRLIEDLTAIDAHLDETDAWRWPFAVYPFAAGLAGGRRNASRAP